MDINDVKSDPVYIKITEENRIFTPRPEYMGLFLTTKQNYFWDLLNHRGHLLLNDLYDELDLPRTPQGALIGWTKGFDGDMFLWTIEDGYFTLVIYPGGIIWDKI